VSGDCVHASYIIHIFLASTTLWYNVAVTGDGLYAAERIDYAERI
jgi:hypothetical protein